MHENELFHLGISTDIRGDYALLPGDPARTDLIASCLEEARPLGQRREYRSFLGRLGNARVIVCSTGIGGPSAAIAVEELRLLGVHTFVRIGTCGGMQIPVLSGDLVIPTAAVRFEGTSDHYAPGDYPAAADFYVTAALQQAAKAAGFPVHLGVVHCKDSFYGQHAPEKSPVSRMLKEKWEAYKRLGVLASEMESAAVFTVAAALGARAGCVLHCIWNQERAAAGLENPKNEDTNRAIRCAVDAIRLLAEDAPSEP